MTHQESLTGRTIGEVMLRAILIAVGSFLVAGSLYAEEAPQFLLSWGTTGYGPGQFRHPHGIDIGDDERVYVADTYNDRIQVFTKSGAFITEWRDGTSLQDFPMDVAVARNGNVYVIERLACAVKVYSRSGQVLAEWGGYPSLEPGRFLDPEGIAVDDSGYVYVADSNNGRVQKFSADGTLVALWRAPDTIERGTVRGISVDNLGHVYVVDRSYQKILKFTTSGQFITTFGEPPILDSPNYVANDAAGNVYVTDSDHGRIVKFSPTGEVLATWGPGEGASCQFLKVSGIAVDDEGSIYVSEPDEGVPASEPACIQKFGYVSTPTVRQTWGQLKVLYR
jgi:DNA-binding beta-propeller fold protein YncE